MSPIFDCSVDAELLTGMRLARTAIGKGELVVIPTDTVYGVAADAFNPAAVQALLDAKGRGRQSPPPVLIPGIPTLDALAETVPNEVRDLVAAFWPGGLTVILPARSSLSWDLGATRGTVALRMPANTVARELLSETGPLAVSSANTTGKTPATTASEAEAMLGESVRVYLDGGVAGTVPSTIVDATSLGLPNGRIRILRAGVISAQQLVEIVGPEKVEGSEKVQNTEKVDVAEPRDAAAADADPDADTSAGARKTDAKKTGARKADGPG